MEFEVAAVIILISLLLTLVVALMLLDPEAEVAASHWGTPAEAVVERNAPETCDDAHAWQWVFDWRFDDYAVNPRIYPPTAKGEAKAAAHANDAPTMADEFNGRVLMRWGVPERRKCEKCGTHMDEYGRNFPGAMDDAAAEARRFRPTTEVFVPVGRIETYSGETTFSE